MESDDEALKNSGGLGAITAEKGGLGTATAGEGGANDLLDSLLAERDPAARRQVRPHAPYAPLASLA